MSGSYETNIHSTDINDQIHHGKFRSIVTVAKNDKFADFNCADAVYRGDDAACIQAAINSLPENGGIIQLFNDKFRVSVSLSNAGKNNVTIIGPATLIRTADLTGPIFSTTPYGYSNIQTIQNNYPIGVKIISLTDTTMFHPGDIVYIVELNDTYYEHFDVIEYVDSTSVRLQIGLKWGTLAGSSSISPVTGISSQIEINKIDLTDEYSTTIAKDPVIDLTWCRNVKLSNLSFSNIYGTAINIGESFDVNISTIHINGVVDDTLGYGICTSGGTSNVIISDSVICGTRHAITGDRSYNITIMNVIARGITTYANTSTSFDTHQYMKDISYTNCQSDGAYGGLNIRGQRITVTNMQINNTASSGVVIQSMAKDIDINNIQINNTGSWGTNQHIYPFEIASSNVSINNLRIIQDTIPDSTLMRGILISTSNDVNICNFLIDDRSQSAYVHGIETSGTNTNIKLLQGHINTYGNGKSIVLNSGATDCKISDITALKSVVNGGTNIKITNVNTYINENTGTATIPATLNSIVVSHGLAAAPTRVQVTPTSSTQGIGYYVSAKAATTFTITMLTAPTVDVTFDWTAIV